MKPSYVESCGYRVAILDVSEIAGVNLITRINTPPNFRRQGIGGRLLAACCRDADAEGAHLELHISPSGDMDADALYQWYGRFGFVSKPGADHPHLMWRAPKNNS